MSRLLFIISIFAFWITAAGASAQEAQPQIRGPITVTSVTLTADNKARTALFEGNVVAKTPDMTIHSDRMLVHYSEGSGEVTKIEADGNVTVQRDSKVITAGKAVYFAREDRVVFTGEPRATDGESMVTGTKITLHIREDRSQVENSKVFLKNRKAK